MPRVQHGGLRGVSPDQDARASKASTGASATSMTGAAAMVFFTLHPAAA